MNSIKISSLIFFLLLMGCATALKPNFFDMQAREHMKKASALVGEKAYQKAIDEYLMVAEKYPQSKYHHAAIQKAALLNLDPENPHPDLEKGLSLLQKYLTLPIRPKQRASAQMHIAMAKQIIQLKKELSRRTAEKNSLASIKHKQSNKLSIAEKRVKDLEKELARARIQLEEMKEVDLRMHTRRVNGGNEPDGSIKMRPSLHPEAYSREPVTEPQKATKRDSFPNRDKPSLNGPAPSSQSIAMNEHKARSAASMKEATNRGAYPFTVQVGSFLSKKDSIFEAMKAREYGVMGFTSEAVIPGKGKWHRVFAGVFKTMAAAKQKALALRKRDYPGAFAVKMPYAIQVEQLHLNENTKNVVDKLQDLGYLAYHLPGKTCAQNPFLLGAFSSEEETKPVTNSLRAQGYRATVILR